MKKINWKNLIIEIVKVVIAALAGAGGAGVMM
jgi:hypothetical protein